MCGVAGLWGQSQSEDVLREAVTVMADAVRRRGPDSSGTWVDAPAGIALGHRRLAVLDLSAGGHQPMVSASGRYVITYNGEVYNYRELRAELTGRVDFRSQSDTEVLLAAMDVWGLEPAVRRFEGIFAFGVWDRQERCLSLVRDPLGVKPLAWGWAGNTLLFGSELKSLTRRADFDRSLSRQAVAAYFRRNCVPAPLTIYEAARKVLPGTILTFTAPRRDASREARYWSAAETALAGKAAPFRGTKEEAIDALDDAIRGAVRRQLVADVPVGAFLSGGVDSSTVAAVIQAQAGQRLRTFSIGNESRAWDESAGAARIARHLGTDHTALTITAVEAQAIIPRLPEMFDEPFADSSQIPTFLVASLARKDVTVALSGDGGDELFGGYNRHLWGPRIAALLGLTSARSRRTLATAATRPSPEAWNALFALLPGLSRVVRLPGQKIHKLAGLLGTHDADSLYQALTTHWPMGSLLDAPATAPVEQARGLTSITDRFMFNDLVGYLPDDILTKVDRTSMAVSLEARVPLLDPRLVAFAWALPTDLKIRRGEGKWILRRVLERHLPTDILSTAKMGFGVPIGDWLRGPMRAWAESLLESARRRNDGLLDLRPINEKWRAHIAGRGSGEYLLWDLLMFEAWRAHSESVRAQ